MSQQISLDEVPKTYERAVQVLAAAHAEGFNDVRIYVLPDPQKQVVRLIEVSDAFPEGGVDRPARPSGMERVVPVFPMQAARDFPFRSEVVQVKAVEWDQLRQGTLRLNRDWGDLNAAQQVSYGE